MISRILVSGVSGPIGASLLPSLKTRGFEVTRLVRGAAAGDDQISWNPAKPSAPNMVSGFDAVIHLAGESIVGRWTKTKKIKIRSSRVAGTTTLAEALAAAQDKPQEFVCGSANGNYVDRGEEGLNEERQTGIGTVQMRTGVVLSPKGGALGKMLTPFKMGVGGKIGDGQQWMSWIDAQDMVGAIHHILKSDLLQGPVNMVAPKPVTNAEFAKTLGGVLSRPAILPVPAFAVKLAFGEMGETVLLGSQRVEPTQLVMSGYPFRFSSLRASLENTLRR